MGIVVNVVLKTLPSVSFLSVHSNSVESWRNSLSANVLTDYFGRNFPIKFIMPITQGIPFLSVGRGMPRITFFFISSGSMPLADILSLKKVISCTPNWYLTPFSLCPFSRTLCSTLVSFSLCSRRVSPPKRVRHQHNNGLLLVPPTCCPWPDEKSQMLRLC